MLMTTMTQISTRAGGVTSDEKFVIFASSLGTVFEWYDFYLYAVLAPFFAALFFPPGNDTAALLSAFATYAAGFLVRPFGALVFSHRRPGRPEVYLPCHDRGDGFGDVPCRPVADLRCHRLGRAGSAGDAPPGAGSSTWRRIRRCRNLRRGAFPTQRTRLHHKLHPDHGDARLLPGIGDH